MHFEQFKEYHEEYLHVIQRAVAHELNIKPAVLSVYERNERRFPNDLLPVMKRYSE
ncbi:hypothetical protein ACFQ38_01605 [Sporosarcina contaminans]|uniref:Transcriptional regulator n=1 Tax=Sporosarcina contaminans TaxID=633403 RepID=A0ABW3TVG0_9BACL